MNTKKIVLIVGLIALAFVFVVNNPIMFGFCNGIDDTGYGPFCYDSAMDIPESASLASLFIGGFLLLLSLITYRMKDEVFRAWWHVALWFVPIIIAVTYLLENAGSGGGLGIGGAVSAGFDVLVLSILYIVFIITSLVRIVSTYRKTR